MNRQKVVVIGGSIAGLTGALALHAQGFDVTIVERDPSPSSQITPQNSNTWTRRGAPHALQPHVLTARLRNVLHEWYPELVRDLLEAGVWEQPFEDTLHPNLKYKHRTSSGDEPITVLMSRRTTLELVMRRHVMTRGIAKILDGTQVTSLIIESGRVPIEVRGVRISDAEGERELASDVVIDASGRATRFAEELREAGARITDEYHPSNSVYYARHYRLLPGKSFPDTFGLAGVNFADFIAAALPGDNGAFIVTFGLFKDDPILFNGVNQLGAFEEICRRIPRIANWVDPSVSEPTSGVMGWANMDFLWRSTVLGGIPQVRNFFFAGDSVLRSNPKYGRGCTCGTIGSHLLAQTLASVEDPLQRVHSYETALDHAFRREWEDLLKVDRSDYERFRDAAGLQRATLGRFLQAKLQDHILKRAIIVDPLVHRTIMKGFFGLAEATAWSKDPMTWLRLIRAALPIHDREIFRDLSIRPTREQMKSLIATVAGPK